MYTNLKKKMYKRIVYNAFTFGLSIKLHIKWNVLVLPYFNTDRDREEI